MYVYLLWEKIGWVKIRGVKDYWIARGSSVDSRLDSMLGMESDVVVENLLHLLSKFLKIKSELLSHNKIIITTIMIWNKWIKGLHIRMLINNINSLYNHSNM